MTVGIKNRQRGTRGRKFLALLAPLALIAAIGGCGIARDVAVSASTDIIQDLVVSIRRQPDPELVRQGLPAVMLVIDGLLASSPEDPDLLLAATNAYVGYCQAFLVDEADGARAVKLYARAREYGLRLLRQRFFFAAAFDKSIEEYLQALDRFTIEDVPHLHAAATAWLGWIIADPESMKALAELPRALALTDRVLALDESYGDGSSHLVFAILLAVQPRGAGQDLVRSKRHFERAIELAGPGNLLPQVLYAEYYGKATLDDGFFARMLTQVLDVDPTLYPENRLLNEIARQRAAALLSLREDIF